MVDVIAYSEILLTFLIHVFYIIPQSHFVIENINIHTSITGMSILPWERFGDLWGRLVNARLVQKFEYVMVRYQPIFVVVVFICRIEMWVYSFFVSKISQRILSNLRGTIWWFIVKLEEICFEHCILMKISHRGDWFIIGLVQRNCQFEFYIGRYLFWRVMHQSPLTFELTLWLLPSACHCENWRSLQMDSDFTWRSDGHF